MGRKKKHETKRQPVWQDIIPAKNLPKSRLKKPPRTIEIKLSLPHFISSLKLTKIKRQIKKIPKITWIIISIILVVGIAVLIYLFRSPLPTNLTPNQNTSDNKPPIDTGADSDQPKYQTITPVGKNIGQLGGWTRVSPINSNPVFAYVDHIGNIPIRVSQQPLPDQFKQEDTAAQIDQLAIGYNANEKITVDNISVHIGTNSKGPQSVIFTKDGLLILITSSAKITNDQWANYISSLQ